MASEKDSAATVHQMYCSTIVNYVISLHVCSAQFDPVDKICEPEDRRKLYIDLPTYPTPIPIIPNHPYTFLPSSKNWWMEKINTNWKFDYFSHSLRGSVYIRCFNSDLNYLNYSEIRLWIAILSQHPLINIFRYKEIGKQQKNSKFKIIVHVVKPRFYYESDSVHEPDQLIFVLTVLFFGYFISPMPVKCEIETQ